MSEPRPVSEVVAGWSDTKRKHPLAHEDGILVFSLLLADGMRTVKVSSQCGWRGKRQKLTAEDRTCPRCGEDVEVIDPDGCRPEDLEASGLFRIVPTENP